MSYWKIAKQFDFCYGHSVYVQELNTEYSLDNRCVCRHLHGHQGKVVVHLCASELNKQSMVTDFKHLNWFKKFLDDALDHKFIVGFDDPGIKYFVPKVDGVEYTKTGKGLLHLPEGYSIVNPDVYKTLDDQRLIELLEGFVFVDFVPTSENLSKWLFEIVKKKMDKINVDTESVLFFETPKSQSHYWNV
jgi:6-pyruvoyltetrahydropterin/6-carboxytetrahydropterin synthase